MTSAGLRVSGEELSSLASRYFGAVEVTFENESSAWVHIERVDVDFGGEAKNRAVLIPWGEELRSWYSATVQRNQIRETNRELALGAIALGGSALATFGGDGEQAGGLLAVGALAAITVDEAQKDAQATERVRMFPDEHLLAAPFSIPPALFVKRWIVLNTQDSPAAPCIDRVLITYQFTNQRYERVLLKFKTPSEWQQAPCERT